MEGREDDVTEPLLLDKEKKEEIRFLSGFEALNGKSKNRELLELRENT